MRSPPRTRPTGSRASKRTATDRRRDPRRHARDAGGRAPCGRRDPGRTHRRHRDDRRRREGDRRHGEARAARLRRPAHASRFDATWTPLDDFEHGTRAAIAGGVTTVVSMVYQEEGSLRRGIERGLRDASRSLADFAFHVVATDPSEAAMAELPALVREGHAGLKVFM